MVDKILSHIFELPFVKAFRLKTTPRWIILLIDMLIVTASYLMIVFGDTYAWHKMLPSTQILLNWFVIITVYFLVTYLSKSYTCVIRLSVIEDLYRTFLVVVTSTVMLVFINMVVHLVREAPLFSYWNVLIIGALTFSMMMIERLLIKYFYMRLTSANDVRRRVLVLGTSLDSLILANALKSEIGGKYEPVGLLSIKNGKENEQINGFKVYRFDPDNVASIFVGNSIYALIFSASNNELMRSGFADHFIRNNIALLSINKVEEFELDNDKEENNANISTFIKEVQIEDLLGRDPIVLNNSLVNNNIKGQCVLITGACGSIGSEIVPSLKLGSSYMQQTSGQFYGSFNNGLSTLEYNLYYDSSTIMFYNSTYSSNVVILTVGVKNRRAFIRATNYGGDTQMWPTEGVDDISSLPVGTVYLRSDSALGVKR